MLLLQSRFREAEDELVYLKSVHPEAADTWGPNAIERMVQRLYPEPPVTHPYKTKNEREKDAREAKAKVKAKAKAKRKLPGRRPEEKAQEKEAVVTECAAEELPAQSHLEPFDDPLQMGALLEEGVQQSLEVDTIVEEEAF